MRLVLLHSPLVGPATWRLLKPALEARGYDVVLPDYRHLMRGDGPYYEKIARVIRGVVAPAADSIVFVAHSGAGALVPMVAEGYRSARAIFMDALLPHPGESWFATASDSLKQQIMSLARDGRVPPWHLWWPKGAIENLLGPLLFAEFVRELGELPVAYFEETSPDAPDLPAERCAYLQLSPAYGEANLARARGWPVRRMNLNHLATLTHPEAVAVAVDELAQTLD